MTGGANSEAGGLAEARVLAAAGRLEEARLAIDRAMSATPDDPDVLHFAGILAAQRGEHVRAIGLLHRAAVLTPTPTVAAVAYLNLARALRAAGRLSEALAAHERAIRNAPQAVDVIRPLGSVLLELKRWQQAGRVFQRVLDLPSATCAVPGATVEREMEEAALGLGTALSALGLHADAANALRRALAVNPHSQSAHWNLGWTLLVQGHADEAATAARRALEEDPKQPGAWVSLANVARHQGDRVRAVEHGLRAIEADPDYALARFNLVVFDRHRLSDPELRDIEARVAQLTAPAQREDATYLHFTLAHSYELRRDFDRAFHWFETGNRRVRDRLLYDVGDEEQLMHAMRTTFTAAFLQSHRGAGDPDHAPIFIVGMPRAGSTLVEQILASHPDVHGAGELTALRKVTRDRWRKERREGESLIAWLARLDDPGYAAIGGDYLRQVGRPAAKPRFTDKLPANFTLVGLIALALPNARIVHVRRDPLDTCFGCYRHSFAGGQHFSYDFDDLARYYAAYRALMEHWLAALPGRVLDFEYEALLADQEGATRRLLDFCGLDWNAACLEFHRTERVVLTASAVQVRQPLNRESLGFWRHYERHLRPLRAALDRRTQKSPR